MGQQPLPKVYYIFLCLILTNMGSSTIAPVIPAPAAPSANEEGTELTGVRFMSNSNQLPLPPDASAFATPEFDIHKGRCPDFKFDCDNSPIRYYCLSDLPCSRFQKCCFYACNYVCTLSVGWWNRDMPPPSLEQLEVQQIE